MDNSTKKVYNLLKSTSRKVYQNEPDVKSDLPCITFYIANDVPQVGLDKDIKKQDIEVVVDFWGKDSKITGEMFREIEAVMRANGFILSFNTAINESDDYSHVNTRFIY